MDASMSTRRQRMLAQYGLAVFVLIGGCELRSTQLHVPRFESDYNFDSVEGPTTLAEADFRDRDELLRRLRAPASPIDERVRALLCPTGEPDRCDAADDDVLFEQLVTQLNAAISSGQCLREQLCEDPDEEKVICDWSPSNSVVEVEYARFQRIRDQMSSSDCGTYLTSAAIARWNRLVIERIYRKSIYPSRSIRSIVTAAPTEVVRPGDILRITMTAPYTQLLGDTNGLPTPPSQTTWSVPIRRIADSELGTLSATERHLLDGFVRSSYGAYRKLGPGDRVASSSGGGRRAPGEQLLCGFAPSLCEAATAAEVRASGGLKVGTQVSESGAQGNSEPVAKQVRQHERALYEALFDPGSGALRLVQGERPRLEANMLRVLIGATAGQESALPWADVPEFPNAYEEIAVPYLGVVAEVPPHGGLLAEELSDYVPFLSDGDRSAGWIKAEKHRAFTATVEIDVEVDKDAISWELQNTGEPWSLADWEVADVYRYVDPRLRSIRFCLQANPDECKLGETFEVDLVWPGESTPITASLEACEQGVRVVLADGTALEGGERVAVAYSDLTAFAPLFPRVSKPCEAEHVVLSVDAGEQRWWLITDFETSGEPPHAEWCDQTGLSSNCPETGLSCKLERATTLANLGAYAYSVIGWLRYAIPSPEARGRITRIDLVGLGEVDVIACAGDSRLATHRVVREDGGARVEIHPQARSHVDWPSLCDDDLGQLRATDVRWVEGLSRDPLYSVSSRP